MRQEDRDLLFTVTGSLDSSTSLVIVVTPAASFADAVGEFGERREAMERV